MSIQVRCQSTTRPDDIRTAVEALGPLADQQRAELDKVLRVNLLLLANHMCALDAAEEAAWRIVGRIRSHLATA